jgi:hypothetical protein
MASKDDLNEEQQNKGNDSDDTFGLPEIEYNPINREEESSSSNEPVETNEYQPESQQSQYEYQSQSQESKYSYTPEEEESPVWPKILGILVVVVVALGAALYFIWYKPAQEKEALLAKQKQEQEARDKKERDRLAEEARLREEAERRKADSLASIPKVGVFEQLAEPTGRYYVVIASAVDGDLITDHAKKLSTTGISTKIIPPYGKYKFYRLTVADGDTYASAQDIANSKKAEFGENTWVLKY